MAVAKNDYSEYQPISESAYEGIDHLLFINFMSFF